MKIFFTHVWLDNDGWQRLFLQEKHVETQVIAESPRGVICLVRTVDGRVHMKLGEYQNLDSTGPTPGKKAQNESTR